MEVVLRLQQTRGRTAAAKKEDIQTNIINGGMDHVYLNEAVPEREIESHTHRHKQVKYWRLDSACQKGREHNVVLQLGGK